jgi:DNA polymerase-3 subunit epsilon
MTGSKERSILLIDIETTGFLDKGGSIIEIGIAALDLETGKITGVFDSLLKSRSTL